MSFHSSPPRWDRPVPPRLILLIAAVAAVIAVVVLNAGASTAHPITAVSTGVNSSASTHHASPAAAQEVDASGPVGIADGYLPSRATVFTSQYLGIRNLNSSLLTELRAAATQAGRDGVQFYVSSGWRSVRYQQELLDEAVTKYGSIAAASHWVAPPALSSHVTGQAVDIANVDAQSWLARDGAAFGLCRIYANETWHFELRPEAERNGCPAMYNDAAHDPRMQQ